MSRPIKYYRIAYNSEEELFIPQVGFRQWVKWWPFIQWCFITTDKKSGFSWSEDDYRFLVNGLHSTDLDTAEANLIMAKNHFEGVDNAEDVLANKIKEFNKTKNYKVKIL